MSLVPVAVKLRAAKLRTDVCIVPCEPSICGSELLACGLCCMSPATVCFIPKVGPSEPSHDERSSSGTGRVHPSLKAGECYPHCPGGFRSQFSCASWDPQDLGLGASEARGVGFLLLGSGDAQTMHKRFNSHGNLLRFPGWLCEVWWCR